MPTDSELLSSVIGEIYDAALDSSLWPKTLDAVRAFLDTRTAVLQVYDLYDNNPPWNWHVGYEPKFLQLHEERNFGPKNPTGEMVARLGAGESLHASGREEYAGLLRSEFYLDWLKPQGLIDAAALMVDKSVTQIAVLVTVRHETQGLFDESTMRRLDLLYPHFRRAVLIGRIVDRAEKRLDTFEAMMDRLSAGIVFMGPKGEIRHANAAATSMLETGFPIRSARGSLEMATTEANRALRAALAASLDGLPGLGAKGVSIPIEAEPGGEFIAHMLPLDAARRKAVDPGRDSVAALLIRRNDPTSAAAVAAVAKRYSLTPQEARVLKTVVEVGGVPLAAEALGVSSGTVRTHVTSIFDKTGVRTQARLVRLLTDNRSPFVDG